MKGLLLGRLDYSVVGVAAIVRGIDHARRYPGHHWVHLGSNGRAAAIRISDDIEELRRIMRAPHPDDDWFLGCFDLIFEEEGLADELAVAQDVAADAPGSPNA